jgi:hypothetical protein
MTPKTKTSTPPPPLSERVLDFLREEWDGSRQLAMEVAENAVDRGPLSEREKDLLDWGTTCGLAFVLALQDAPEDRLRAMHNARHAAAGAFAQWSSPRQFIAPRPMQSPLVERVINAAIDAEGWRHGVASEDAVKELGRALTELTHAFGSVSTEVIE